MDCFVEFVPCDEFISVLSYSVVLSLSQESDYPSICLGISIFFIYSLKNIYVHTCLIGKKAKYLHAHTFSINFFITTMPYIYFCSEVAERERIKWIYRPAPLFIIKVFCHQVECGTRGYGFYPPTFQYRNCVQRLSIFDLYLREVLPLRRLGKFNTVSSSNFCAVSGPVWGCFLK